MRARSAIVCFLLLLPALVSAQTQATPNDKFALDIPGTDAAAATAYTWRMYLDGATTGTIMPGAVCTLAGAVITCTFPIPVSFTAGAHTATMTAANASSESPKTNSLSFVLVKAPGQPVNLRIIVTP